MQKPAHKQSKLSTPCLGIDVEGGLQHSGVLGLRQVRVAAQQVEARALRAGREGRRCSQGGHAGEAAAGGAARCVERPPAAGCVCCAVPPTRQPRPRSMQSPHYSDPSSPHDSSQASSDPSPPGSSCRRRAPPAAQCAPPPAAGPPPPALRQVSGQESAWRTARNALNAINVRRWGAAARGRGAGRRATLCRRQLPDAGTKPSQKACWPAPARHSLRPA